MGWQQRVDRLHGAAKRTFGEPVLYRPVGGGETEIQGIFTAAHTEIDFEREGALADLQPTLGIREADLTGDVVTGENGDVFVVRGTSYYPAESQPDGEGMTVLHLFEVPGA